MKSTFVYQVSLNVFEDLGCGTQANMLVQIRNMDTFGHKYTLELILQ